VLIHAILHINIRVPAHKLAQCRDFYCNVLGLSVGPRPPFESHGFWLYAGAAPVVHLVQMSAAEAAAEVAHGRSALDHVAFGVEVVRKQVVAGQVATWAPHAFDPALAQAARPRRARHDAFLQGIESRFEVLTEVGAETDAL